MKASPIVALLIFFMNCLFFYGAIFLKIHALEVIELLFIWGEFILYIFSCSYLYITKNKSDEEKEDASLFDKLLEFSTALVFAAFMIYGKWYFTLSAFIIETFMRVYVSENLYKETKKV